ncbi:MAG: endonuclease domain-containing protein [Methanosarcina sp.]
MSRVNYENFVHVKYLSRNLRKNLTPSERVLWNILRDKKVLGFRFLRQHPLFYRINDHKVKFYVADFYCAKLRLIIELDGPIHEFTVENDKERDENLIERGYNIIRYKNDDLLICDKFIQLLQSDIIKLSKTI